MKKPLLLLSFFLLSTALYSQNDPLYSQYMSNPLLINPAYSGINNRMNASIAYRMQWAGFEGNPTTFNVSGHSSFADNKMGLGLLIIQDNIGSNKNTEANASYSFKIEIGKSVLSLGLQGGAINYRTVNSELNIYDPSDPAFNKDDQIWKPSFGAGIILKNEQLFLGFSIPRMLNNTITFNDVQTELYSRHFYANAAYVFFLSERIRLKPSALLKGVKGSPLSLDFNTSINIDEKYTAGVFTRNLNTYGVLAFFNFGKGYRMGYTFEVPTKKSVGTQFTSHEFSLGVNLSVFSFQDSSITSF